MSRKKILLVDDSSTILMMEKFILRNDPYILLTASSGESAVRRAAIEKPDLIVLDANMPGMSGLEACRLIRATEELANVPIILITTSDTHTGAEPLDCCTSSLTKPISALELLAKVRQLLADTPDAL
jgi:CheY-like chemotaxis protein